MVTSGAELAFPAHPNALGLDNEIQRIAALADGLDAAGHDLRGVRTDSWTGPAKDGFDQAHLAVVKNWQASADHHAEAVAALTRYRSAVDEVTRRCEWAEQELAGADPLRRLELVEQIERWRGQLSDVGSAVAGVLRQLTERMAGVRRVLDAPGARPAPEASPDRFPPDARQRDDGDQQGPPQPDGPQPGPLLAHDRVLYRSRVIAVNNAVLAVWQGNPQPGRRADRAGSGG